MCRNCDARDLVNNDFSSLNRRSWDMTRYGIDILNDGTIFTPNPSSLQTTWDLTNMGMASLMNPGACMPPMSKFSICDAYPTIDMSCMGNMYPSYPMMPTWPGMCPGMCPNMCPTEPTTDTTDTTETTETTETAKTPYSEVEKYFNDKGAIDESVINGAEIIHDSLGSVPVFNENSEARDMIERLAKENPEKLAALEIYYGMQYGGVSETGELLEPDKLRKDLRSSCGLVRGWIGAVCPKLSPSSESINILNEYAANQTPMNKCLALHEATQDGLIRGCDEKTVDKVLSDCNDEELVEINTKYKELFGHPVQQDIRNIGYYDKKEYIRKLNLANFS